MADEFVEQLRKEVGAQLSQAGGLSLQKPQQSSEYETFKKEHAPLQGTLYEKVANTAHSLLQLKIDGLQAKELQTHLDTAHLSISPSSVFSLAVLVPMIISVPLSVLLFAFTGWQIQGLIVGLLSSLALYIPLYQYPSYLAQKTRMKAADQMVLSIFYIVTYMRHTSNLERAIEFASHHLSYPLSLDFKKIIWDVETRKYDSILDSVESYLLRWNSTHREFVDAFHLIIGSLYEGHEDKRQELLSKSLDLMLSETYDKMLHFAHGLKSPITALNMLGIVLPILGLTMLPIMVNFIPEITWQWIMIGYNVLLPIIIFALSKSILNGRPSGYSGIEIDTSNPQIKRIVGESKLPQALTISWLIVVAGIVIGFVPILLHVIGFSDFGWGLKIPDAGLSTCGYEHCFIGWKKDKGPMGLGTTLLSFAIPLGIMGGIWYYYREKTKKIMEIRKKTKELEDEFVAGLFSLANRLGDGMPAELAFDKVANQMPNTTAGSFFALIGSNISRLGMSVNDAIFHNSVGAIRLYPSKLIESSMNVLVQSSSKGPKIASSSIENIARYIREMNRVQERLTDLMAEDVSSMKSQISFLTPIIAGIVISLTSLITTILSLLSGQVDNLDLGTAGAQANVAKTLLETFKEGVPTFFFSLIIGLYVIQIVYLLSSLINTILFGFDQVNEESTLASNMSRSVLLYIVCGVLCTLLFNSIAGSIIKSFLQ
jgi:hypothetical protein